MKAIIPRFRATSLEFILQERRRIVTNRWRKPKCSRVSAVPVKDNDVRLRGWWCLEYASTRIKQVVASWLEGWLTCTRLPIFWEGILGWFAGFWGLFEARHNTCNFMQIFRCHHQCEANGSLSGLLCLYLQCPRCTMSRASMQLQRNIQTNLTKDATAICCSRVFQFFHQCDS